MRDASLPRHTGAGRPPIRRRPAAHTPGLGANDAERPRGAAGAAAAGFGPAAGGRPRRLRLALVALALVAACAAGSARAQQAAQPPNRFYGALVVGGQPAQPGTMVTAVISDIICGSRATTERGRYQVDVLSTRERPGCGLGGAVVSFRIGGQTANETGSWSAGQFTRLDLSVGGGGAAGRFDTARVDLESPCIPSANQDACDDTRRRLWAADPDAWAAALAARGRSNPSPEDVFDEALRMRLAANDPAAMGAVARVLGWPHLRITAVHFRGTGAQQEDEWIEITNLGGGSQLMDGWVIRAQGTGAEFAFPDGFTLEAGAACRVYSAAARPDSCVAATFNRPNVWSDAADTALLLYTPLDLRVDRTRYNADPAAQPPPPNLQGVR